MKIMKSAMKSGKQRKAEIKAARLLREKCRKMRREAPTFPVWTHAPAGTAPCDSSQLAPSNSYGVPAFVARGYYVDQPFRCRDCGVEEVWTAERQKWWYEVAKGNVETCAVRCKQCRAKERARKNLARAVQQAGLRQKQARLALNG